MLGNWSCEKIGRVRDDPPTVLVSVHIPYVMAVTEDVFGVNFLTEFHLQVRSLAVHVANDFIGFFLRCFKHIYPSMQDFPVSRNTKSQSRLIFKYAFHHLPLWISNPGCLPIALFVPALFVPALSVGCTAQQKI
jgi:hypothetical protein